MLTIIKLDKNLPLNMAKAAEVDSKTSSIIRLPKNLSASVDIADNIKVGENTDNGDDEIIKRLFLLKKSNIFIKYFIFIHLKKQVFSNSFCHYNSS